MPTSDAIGFDGAEVLRHAAQTLAVSGHATDVAIARVLSELADSSPGEQLWNLRGCPFCADAPPSAASIAEFLESLSAETGDETYARAANTLRQQPPGRRRTDDRGALIEVARLIESGDAKSPRAAFLAVARRLAKRGAEHAFCKRLERKWREKSGTK